MNRCWWSDDWKVARICQIQFQLALQLQHCFFPSKLRQESVGGIYQTQTSKIPRYRQIFSRYSMKDPRNPYPWKPHRILQEREGSLVSQPPYRAFPGKIWTLVSHVYLRVGPTANTSQDGLGTVTWHSKYVYPSVTRMSRWDFFSTKLMLHGEFKLFKKSLGFTSRYLVHRCFYPTTQLSLYFLIILVRNKKPEREQTNSTTKVFKRSFVPPFL